MRWNGQAEGLAFGADCVHDSNFPQTPSGVCSMVLCPVAIAVGCKKCPIFSVCPVKSVIGDYKPEEKDAKGGAARPKKTTSRK
jgi:hypothetical protein